MRKSLPPARGAPPPARGVALGALFAMVMVFLSIIFFASRPLSVEKLRKWEGEVEELLHPLDERIQGKLHIQRRACFPTGLQTAPASTRCAALPLTSGMGGRWRTGSSPSSSPADGTSIAAGAGHPKAGQGKAKYLTAVRTKKKGIMQHSVDLSKMSSKELNERYRPTK